MSASPTLADGALVGAAEAGRLADLVAPDSPARAALTDAGRLFARPLRVQIIGRPGTGRDMLGRALRDRLSVDAAGPATADASVTESLHMVSDAAVPDLWIHVLTGPPRAADHEELRMVPSDRCLVVLNKADTIGGPAAAADVAGRCGRELGGRTVYPVSALLACAQITAADLDFLRALAVVDVRLPALTGLFLTDRLDASGMSEAEELRTRAGLLERLDRYGLERVLGVLGSVSGPAARTDASPEALTRMLRSESGIGGLVGPIRERLGVVRHWRIVELRHRLELLAVRGVDRDAIEQLLQGVVT